MEKIWRCEFCDQPFVAGNTDYHRHIQACREAAQRKLDDEWIAEKNKRALEHLRGADNA